MEPKLNRIEDKEENQRWTNRTVFEQKALKSTSSLHLREDISLRVSCLSLSLPPLLKSWLISRRKPQFSFKISSNSPFTLKLDRKLDLPLTHPFFSSHLHHSSLPHSPQTFSSTLNNSSIPQNLKMSTIQTRPSPEQDEIDYEGLGGNVPLHINMIAGALAGISEHAVMFPVDVIRVSSAATDSIPERKERIQGNPLEWVMKAQWESDGLMGISFMTFSFMWDSGS